MVEAVDDPLTRPLLTEPPDVYLDDHIFDLKFSPKQNVMALGQITG